MLNIRNEFCIGCGICTKACPTGAISVKAGKAQINQSVCIQCYRCANACPRGAIKEEIPFLPTISVPARPFARGPQMGFAQWGVGTSLWELRTSLLRLQKNVQILNERLNRLENR